MDGQNTEYPSILGHPKEIDSILNKLSKGIFHAKVTNRHLWSVAFKMIKTTLGRWLAPDFLLIPNIVTTVRATGTV